MIVSYFFLVKYGKNRYNNYTMEKICRELTEQIDIRKNLSTLRQLIKDDENHRKLLDKVEAEDGMWLSFLQSEDPKTRKNAALLLGDLEYQPAMEALWEAYCRESTLFVKSAYLTALSWMNVESKLGDLHRRLEELCALQPREEERKHIEEEIRSLRRILILYEGISHHEFSMDGQIREVLLTANRLHRDVVCQALQGMDARLHPLGVLVNTDRLEPLTRIRTYRELLFVIHTKEYLPQDAGNAAQMLMESDLISLVKGLHEGEGAFYFRVECQSSMDLEKRSAFAKKLGAGIERMSDGLLVNSATDYEIELRLVENREGKFFPCLKCYTWKDPRFAYRKNVIATSIHPATAALVMELAKPYLKENAQIMDPFCGVGTMLIERSKAVAAREMYGTDIFGEAIEKGRENASLAKCVIRFIHRDFFDFKHEYPFDEIVTNMPVRGKRTKEEMDRFYEEFFRKVPEITASEATIVMYTGEVGFVKKQLRLNRGFTLLQETCMQKKSGFYLLIIGVKR
jgi:tRNA G10  N-methylase Trm11